MQVGRMLRRVALGCACALGGAFGSASPARAALTMCNKTPYKVVVAVAFFKNDAPGTTTNGEAGGSVHAWVAVAAGACEQVDGNAANAGSFYYLAETQPTGHYHWGGSARLCVTNQRFEDQQLFLIGNQRCPRGRDARGFARIDSNTANYTESLFLRQ